MQDQINNKEDDEPLEAIKSAFPEKFEARPHQAAIIKLVTQ